MNPNLERVAGRWLYARAENILAAMLGLMFAAFILQIVFRYLLNLPIGWTNETERHPLDMAGAVRRGLRRARGGGNPLRPDLFGRRTRQRGASCS